MHKRLFIEPPMTLAEASAWTTPAELAAAGEFGSERRRREYLAWRAIVRRELGRDVEIAYDEAGAPVVVGQGVCLGVAHCADRIAVCISDMRCAVDIEPETRNFQRAAARYMTIRERALSDDPLLPAVVWCAKEALYKYAGRRELDLLRDLSIDKVDLEAGTIMGHITNGKPVPLSVLRREGFIAVYIL